MLTTGIFWHAAIERAVRTAAQAIIALIGTNAVGVTDVDWLAVGSASALAAVVSLLTSIGSGALTGTGPSLTDAEVLPAQD